MVYFIQIELHLSGNFPLNHPLIYSIFPYNFDQFILFNLLVLFSLIQLYIFTKDDIDEIIKTEWIYVPFDCRDLFFILSTL